jgi:hypothetical protein
MGRTQAANILQCLRVSNSRLGNDAEDIHLRIHSIWGAVAPARFFAGKYTVSCLHSS